MVGAASLHHDIADYFMAFNIPLMEWYGMSESTGPQTASIRGFNQWRPGSCGKSIDGVETGICNPDKDGIGEVSDAG